MQKIGRFTWKATGVNSIPIDLVLDSSNLFLAAPDVTFFLWKTNQKGHIDACIPPFLMEGTNPRGQ